MSEFASLADGGFTLRMPAGPGRTLFTQEAADSIVGTYTDFHAHEDEIIQHTWRMKVVAAELEDGGAAMLLTLRQPELGEDE